MNTQNLNLNRTDLKWRIIRRLEALDPTDSIFVGAVVLALKERPEDVDLTFYEILGQWQDNPKLVESMLTTKTIDLIREYRGVTVWSKALE